MIYLHLPGLPPSANQAYLNLPSKKTKNGMRRGGRTLTRAGEAYKNEVIAHVTKHTMLQAKSLHRECILSCLIAYGFTDVFTKGFPAEAKHRFVKQDLANRPKLLQDALCEALALDDSQICFDFKYKYQSTEAETRIWIWNEDDEPFGQQLLAAFTQIAGGSRPV